MRGFTAYSMYKNPEKHGQFQPAKLCSIKFRTAS